MGSFCNISQLPRFFVFLFERRREVCLGNKGEGTVSCHMSPTHTAEQLADSARGLRNSSLAYHVYSTHFSGLWQVGFAVAWSTPPSRQPLSGWWETLASHGKSTCTFSPAWTLRWGGLSFQLTFLAPAEGVEPMPGQMVHQLVQCVGKEEFLKITKHCRHVHITILPTEYAMGFRCGGIWYNDCIAGN